jgi:tetratricopeptide (TPR) repeat protein
MTSARQDWEEKVAAVWAGAASRSNIDVVEAISVLAAERSPDDAAALFERASAFDYAGREAEAEPLYRAALAAGLDERRRAEAVIQLASTMRNLGRAAASVELLRAEIAAEPADGLADVRAAFLALALVDAGRANEAIAEALTALAPHLTQYGRAVTYYAEELRSRRAS